MPLSINTNIASMTAQRSFVQSNAALETAFERLSTGKRVNSGADDAAGLAIGTRMESRVSGLNQAIRNVNDGISMVQIAEGALDEATTILQRMRDIAVQAANGSMGTTEVAYLQTEHNKLASALDDVFTAAKFNGTDLISGGSSNVLQTGNATTDRVTVTIDDVSATILTVASGQITLAATSGGAAEVVFFGVTLDAGNAADADDLTLTIDGVTYSTKTDTGGFAAISDVVTSLNNTVVGDGTLSSLGYVASATTGGILLTATANGAKSDSAISITENAAGSFAIGSGIVTTQGTATVTNGALDAIDKIDAALNVVAQDRAGLGATQAQLESTVRNLANVAENTSAAVGRIMDADYAAETANLTKAQILQQAATSILAQANAQPQNVLALLQ